jgi:hypothetical protein
LEYQSLNNTEAEITKTFTVNKTTSAHTGYRCNLPIASVDSGKWELATGRKIAGMEALGKRDTCWL